MDSEGKDIAFELDITDGNFTFEWWDPKIIVDYAIWYKEEKPFETPMIEELVVEKEPPKIHELEESINTLELHDIIRMMETIKDMEDWWYDEGT